MPENENTDLATTLRRKAGKTRFLTTQERMIVALAADLLEEIPVRRTDAETAGGINLN